MIHWFRNSPLSPLFLTTVLLSFLLTVQANILKVVSNSSKANHANFNLHILKDENTRQQCNGIYSKHDWDGPKDSYIDGTYSMILLWYNAN